MNVKSTRVDHTLSRTLPDSAGCSTMERPPRTRLGAHPHRRAPASLQTRPFPFRTPAQLQAAPDRKHASPLRKIQSPHHPNPPSPRLGSVQRRSGGNKGFPGGSEVKVSAWNVGDLGSTPGLGRSPGEGNGNPLQDSCLENPMEGGAW